MKLANEFLNGFENVLELSREGFDFLAVDDAVINMDYLARFFFNQTVTGNACAWVDA